MISLIISYFARDFLLFFIMALRNRLIKYLVILIPNILNSKIYHLFQHYIKPQHAEHEMYNLIMTTNVSIIFGKCLNKCYLVPTYIYISKHYLVIISCSVVSIYH